MAPVLWNKAGWAESSGQQRTCSHPRCSLTAPVWARVAGPGDTAARGSTVLSKDEKCSVKLDDVLKILLSIKF